MRAVDQFKKNVRQKIQGINAWRGRGNESVM
eukprot:CAMPEP_0169114442 /NCGR_PEP_ID=MMETSP1015-20121227/28756_1 /TAXON_ID=342587 /ORGANISM="Karlodinium micrum, Strain CCMP2283" /LENGTH=30 /DNA_ID= /DNA_START= /DNA_END= /DNA_ORIENTATION=